MQVLPDNSGVKNAARAAALFPSPLCLAVLHGMI